MRPLYDGGIAAGNVGRRTFRARLRAASGYWRAGPRSTAEMNVTLQAGFCLGGGTVANWTNSLRTTPWVREQWEREFGLEGLAGADFDRHLDAVWERLSVNDRCSQLNGAQQRMKAGAEQLGWSFTLVQRNTDERRYSFETAGHIGFGDPTGAKQSTLKTYLQDAYDRVEPQICLVAPVGHLVGTRAVAGAARRDAVGRLSRPRRAAEEGDSEARQPRCRQHKRRAPIKPLFARSDPAQQASSSARRETDHGGCDASAVSAPGHRRQLPSRLPLLVGDVSR